MFQYCVSGFPCTTDDGQHCQSVPRRASQYSRSRCAVKGLCYFPFSQEAESADMQEYGSAVISGWWAQSVPFGVDA